MIDIIDPIIGIPFNGNFPNNLPILRPLFGINLLRTGIFPKIFDKIPPSPMINFSILVPILDSPFNGNFPNNLPIL